MDDSTTWLDYGCGAGGLVRYLRSHGVSGAVGYDPSHFAPTIPSDPGFFIPQGELDAWSGTCDVITAIEVLEHVYDPVAELKRLRRLLRPGGVLLITTGNAEPHRDRLTKWSYVIPEIHISLFEPRSLAAALERAGLEPVYSGYTTGWADIIRYKVLKNLGRSSVGPFERLVPWVLMSKLIDRRFALSAQPVGRAI